MIDRLRTSQPRRVYSDKEKSMGRRGRTGLVRVLLAGNYAEPGDVVRYIDRQNRTLLVGRIYEDGIQVPGEEGLLTLTGFESKAGVCYRRPTEHIYLQDGRTIMDCQREMDRLGKSGVNGNVSCSEGDAGCGEGSRLVDEHQMLLKDLNDDYCVYCGLGVREYVCYWCLARFFGPYKENTNWYSFVVY